MYLDEWMEGFWSSYTAIIVEVVRPYHHTICIALIVLLEKILKNPLLPSDVSFGVEGQNFPVQRNFSVHILKLIPKVS